METPRRIPKKKKNEREKNLSVIMPLIQFNLLCFIYRTSPLSHSFLPLSLTFSQSIHTYWIVRTISSLFNSLGLVFLLYFLLNFPPPPVPFYFYFLIITLFSFFFLMMRPRKYSITFFTHFHDPIPFRLFLQYINFSPPSLFCNDSKFFKQKRLFFFSYL